MAVQLRRSRILVIDDSITIRALVEQLLTGEAFCGEVATARDVAEARMLISSFFPTIITLDLNMPGTDGWAFLKELQAYRHAPIIVVSSATTEGSDATLEAIAQGAYACFDKAFILSHHARFIRTLKQASIGSVANSIRRQAGGVLSN